MDLFKPEDFNIEYMGVELPDAFPELIAEKANELLKERGQRVYGNKDDDNDFFLWTENPDQKWDTHQALLVGIERITKKDSDTCNHSPKSVLLEEEDFPNFTARCENCGVELKAKWEACD